MKSEIVKEFTNNFDNHSQTTENGIEFWFARDLQHLIERGIKPEELPPEEDIKKLDCRVKSDDINIGKNPDKQANKIASQ